MNSKIKIGGLVAAFAIAGTSVLAPSRASAYVRHGGTQQAVTLLNVSYDPTRELYKDYNNAFARYWKGRTGQNVDVQQSHGGSGKQSRAVVDGLAADVVTLALAYDVDAISSAGLIKPGWMGRLKYNSAPYTSTIVFLVRRGNPKNIRNWEDLARPGVSVITPHPKTSGGARWNYLAAYGYMLKKTKGNQAAAQQFVKQIFKNVPVLDSGARGATNTFVQRGIGDVLIAWENEAVMAVKELGADKVQMVVPSVSILAEPSVAVVDRVVDRKGTRPVATAYLNYLYSDEGQEIAAKHFYRPRNAKIMAKYSGNFPKVSLFTINELFGSWSDAQRVHFRNGGVFDQIYGG